VNGSRWAGRALLAGLGVLLALNLVWVGRHRDVLRPLGGGAAAPAFALPLAGGGEFRSSERPTLIDFWASWCPPCRAQLPTIDRLAARYRDRFDFVAVNVEPPDAVDDVRAYLGQAGLTLPVALGGEGVAARYKVDSLPHTVIVAGGRVHRVLVGPHAEAEIVEALDGALR
jgi:thiol-disulfide isomerase/thioredoxin